MIRTMLYVPESVHESAVDEAGTQGIRIAAIYRAAIQWYMLFLRLVHRNAFFELLILFPDDTAEQIMLRLIREEIERRKQDKGQNT